MTQAQAVKKYGIPRDIICKVIKLAKVQPTGTVPGYTWKEYDEKDIVDAILLYYRNHYLSEVSRADRWKERAHNVKEIYRKSKPVVEDDM